MRPPNFDPNPYWLAPYDWLTSFQGWDPLEVDIIFFVPQTMQWLVITFPINQGKSGYTHIIPYPWLLFIGNVMIFTFPDWNIPSLDTYPWANSLADDCPDGEILSVFVRMPRVFSVPIHPDKTSKYPIFWVPKRLDMGFLWDVYPSRNTRSPTVNTRIVVVPCP